MYSLAPTRAFVTEALFSHDFLVPSGETMALKILRSEGLNEAMRGQSLIGTSTITTGFLGTMWGFSLLANRWPGIDRKWRTTALVASILTPGAMLMTYGRAAWLTIIVIVGLSLIFGFVKSRRNMAILVISLAIILFRVGWQSKLFMTERVLHKTEIALDNPYKDESFSPRLLSYSQPFSHLSKHPIFFFVGAGRVGKNFQSDIT